MIIKLFLCIIGALIVMTFVLPLFSITKNIATIFGTMLGIVLIFTGVFFDYTIARIVLICIGLFLIPFTATIIKIILATKEKEISCNAVIILGCRVKGYKPTIALSRRCEAGAKYLKKYKDAIVIVSGGQGSDEKISEAKCMSNLLMSQGIDKSRIILENKSTSTYENLTFSKRILEEKDIKEPYAIVSSEYHLYRARMIARGCGIEDTLLIPSKSKWYCIPTYFTREVFGIWAKRLKIKE